jgi:hypothetical protein
MSARSLISAPAFRLKGSGWYETDFKSDKERKRNLAEGASDASGADKKDADKSATADKKADGKSAGGEKSSTDKKEAKASSTGKSSGSEAA